MNRIMENPFEELELRQIRIENMLKEILSLLRDPASASNYVCKPAINTVSDLVRIEEACRLTGFTKSTIYDLTHRKAIPHFKRGKTLWFDKNEIEVWIKSGRPAILEGAMKIIRDKNKEQL